MNRAERRKRGMRGPADKRVQVNPESLETHTCQCGGVEFIRTVELKRVPAVLSPVGAPVLMPLEKMARCATCGAVARWDLEDQPKIITIGGNNAVPDVPMEGAVPDVDKGGNGE